MQLLDHNSPPRCRPLDRIYLDICCLKRLFDDQRQARVRREAMAVTDIVARAERGELELVRSPALLVENDANPREDRRLAAALWINGAAIEVTHSAAVARRARVLHALGFGALDALHLAFAEAAGARWLATSSIPLTLRQKVQDDSLWRPAVGL